jgi:mRNA-degrading endonuclease RelE of RelBE toxin-antitoxin system
MKRQVRWTNRALRILRRLDRPTRHRVLDAVDRLATTGEGDLKRLKGERQGILRLRVGGWRVLLIDANHAELVIRSIVPRGDAY